MAGLIYFIFIADFDTIFDLIDKPDYQEVLW